MLTLLINVNIIPLKMVPMDDRDPKRIKKFLIDIEKRVEISPSSFLWETVLEKPRIVDEAWSYNVDEHYGKSQPTKVKIVQQFINTIWIMYKRSCLNVVAIICVHHVIVVGSSPTLVNLSFTL